MQDIKLVSIDVWDTLIRRHCHPDAVKFHVCRYVLLTNFEYLKAAFRDEISLFRARCESEGELGQCAKANGFDDEYSLLEVYQLWVKKIFEEGAGAECIAKELRDVELLQEYRVSYQDPTILRYLEKYDGIKKIFISDFYMPAADIFTILEKNGLSASFSGGYSSCEVSLNKRSGRLFPHVFALEGVSPEHVLHLGDNLHSDVHMPMAHGATGMHYLPRHEHDLRVQKENYLGRYLSIIQDSLKNLEGASCKVFGAQPSDMYMAGIKNSTLFVGFALYVMAEAIKLGHKKIFFFTREGEFFKKIYDALAEQDPFGVPAPKAELLEVSRIATFSASLQGVSLKSLMRLWGLYSTQSMGALFSSLDVDGEQFAPFLSTYGLDFSEEIQYPWLDLRVVELFDNNEFVGVLSELVAVKRTGLLAYLSGKGFPSGGKTAVVDIGWRGTIQDNIAYLLPGVHIDGFYLGLDKYINQQPANVSKYAFGPNMNDSCEMQFSHLFAKVSPIEMLCNSPNGSVVGYFKNEDIYAAKRLVEAAENVSYDEAVLYFQRGVISAAEVLGNVVRTHVVPLQIIRDLALVNWSEITRSPPMVIADAYFMLKHNESFGLGRFDDKTQIISNFVWIKGFISIAGFKQLVRRLESTGWPEGYLASRRIGWFWSFVSLARKVKQKYRGLHL